MHRGIVIGWVLALTACGGVEPDGTWTPAGGKADDPGVKAQPLLSLLTYNAGLARGAVALAEERLPLVIDKLQQSSADVICLQEVWTDEDAARIQNALRDSHPHFFREKTSDTSDKSVPCGMWSTYKLNRCVNKECDPKGISAEECVTSYCADEYNALDDECKLCLAANTDSPVWCAVWPGARDYAWDGRNGLLLLSRHPIDQASYTPFETVLVKRGVIRANIQGVSVQCTHLSSDLKTVPYPQDRRLKSWIEEQQEQVQLLGDATDPQACNVLLGDLNTGPNTAYITAEAFETWQQLCHAAGFEETWPGRQCTWCPDNPLASGTTYQLDHVMLQNCPDVTARYTRMLDGPIQVDSDGQLLETRLSDHYGLLAELIPVQPSVN